MGQNTEEQRDKRDSGDTGQGQKGQRQEIKGTRNSETKGTIFQFNKLYYS